MNRHRFWSWLRRCLGLRTAPSFEASFEAGPLVLPTWAAWAEEPAIVEIRREPVRSRPLAGQLAATARLNVPAGRKPRTSGRLAKQQTPRPVRTAVAPKRSAILGTASPLVARVTKPRALLPQAAIVRLPQPTSTVRPVRTAIAA